MLIKVKIQLTNIYGIQLSHIFELRSISNKKPSVSIETSRVLIKNLGFRSKYQVFQIRNFEIPGFSQLEYEILSISSEISSISKKYEIPGFQWACISSSIDLRSYLRIRRLLDKYYTPAHLDQQRKHSTPFVDSFFIQRVRVVS